MAGTPSDFKLPSEVALLNFIALFHTHTLQMQINQISLLVSLFFLMFMAYLKDGVIIFTDVVLCLSFYRVSDFMFLFYFKIAILFNILFVDHPEKPCY